jgi:hypothetical protein
MKKFPDVLRVAKNAASGRNLKRAYKAVVLGTALGMTACQMPTDEAVRYENVGNGDFDIENRSPLSGGDLQSLVGQILDVYAEMGRTSEFFVDYMKRKNIRTVIDALPPDTPDTIVAWAKTGEYLIFFNYKKDRRVKNDMIGTVRHELIHIMQHDVLPQSALAGLRPDVRGALDMFAEFQAWFFGNKYGSIMPTGLDWSDEIQNDLFASAINPADQKDQMSEWMRANSVGVYSDKIIGEGIRRPIKNISPATDEKILGMMRLLAECRDVGTAGVSDENLMTAYRTLRDTITGKNSYITVGDAHADLFPADVDQADMDKFLAKCGEWDAKFFAMQSRSAER